MAKVLKNTIISSGLLLALCVELYSLLPTPRYIGQPPSAHPLHYLTGVLNVKPPARLGSEAFYWLSGPTGRAGIDFIVATRPSEGRLEEARHGSTDFFVESEVGTPAGDLLVFHSHGEHRHTFGKQLEQLVTETFEGRATANSVFSVMAHPSHVRTPWNRYDRFTEGIELMNFDSQWVRELYDAPLSFFGSLNDEAWARNGSANGSGVTVRAIAYILAGHERHHCQVLKERYLDASHG